MAYDQGQSTVLLAQRKATSVAYTISAVEMDHSWVWFEVQTASTTCEWH